MPRGSLDDATTHAVEAEVQRLCAAGFSAIVIDLRALHFAIPAGETLLRRLGRLAEPHDVTLSLNRATPRTAAALTR
jgi:anti-anti-sigma regulatory factor